MVAAVRVAEGLEVALCSARWTGRGDGICGAVLLGPPGLSPGGRGRDRPAASADTTKLCQ
ncbi:hypothetical protein I546_6617 [Mycobacterium kansasii 732]|nr:hypothetical protein I546_6617 [Mycobacterium kansasii 732]